MGHQLGRAVGQHGVLLRLRRARHLLEHGVAHRRVPRDDAHPEDRALEHVLRATSAIDTSKRARTRSRNFSTTRRLSFSDRACGT